MNDKMIICYTDTTTNTSRYDETFSDIQSWTDAHPSYKINFAFMAKWDLNRKSNNAENEFATFCYGYGLQPSDLHRKFLNSRGQTIEITGYKNANKKYKFLIFNHDDNQNYKVSSSYISNCTPIGGNP